MSELFASSKQNILNMERIVLYVFLESTISNISYFIIIFMYIYFFYYYYFLVNLESEKNEEETLEKKKKEYRFHRMRTPKNIWLKVVYNDHLHIFVLWLWMLNNNFSTGGPNFICPQIFGFFPQKFRIKVILHDNLKRVKKYIHKCLFSYQSNCSAYFFI